MRARRVTHAVLLMAATSVGACSRGGSSPNEPNLAVLSSRTPIVGPDLSHEGQWGTTHKETCSPLPAFNGQASIGTAGGVLRVGPHTLTVPPGALAATVAISGSTEADSVNSVQFLPQGLQFAIPATLSMSYTNCLDRDDPTKTRVIAYTTDDLATLLALLPSEDDKIGKSMSAPISHFSRYAVAY